MMPLIQILRAFPVFAVLMLFAGALLITAAAEAADEEADSAGFEAFIGEWQAECNAFGNPARCTSIWSRGLHASQYQLKYRIYAADGNAVLFEGRGLYRDAGEFVEGYWNDSQGSVYPLYGAWEESALRIDWGTARTRERGRSKYRMNGPNLHVTDTVLTEQGWVEFMTVHYDRSE